jgi:thioredoxin-related protein
MKLLLACTTVLLVACTSLFSPPKWDTDLSKALAQARKENKMTFILLGREECGNCQATRKMVNEGKVPVSADKFVIADINTDDPASDDSFLNRFGRDNFGDTLPFVVITDSNGKALARYSGYKSEEDVTAMVKAACAKETLNKPLTHANTR